jgi:spore coat protein A
VNGAPYPVLPVDRRRYRFRLLNGSQARFYNLLMYIGDSSLDGITLASSLTEVDPNGNSLFIPTNPTGPRMIQIGNEAGFLLEPAVHNNPATPIGFKLASHLGAADPTLGNVNRYNLLLAPAERADIIVDFRDVPAGSEVILYNDAPAPFPGGDIRNDYYTGRPDLTKIGGAPSNNPGQGPDTRIIMKFQVGSGTVKELNFTQTLNALKLALPLTFAATQPSLLIFPSGPAKVKTLNEDFDSSGRLRQILGSPAPSEYLTVPMDTAHHGEVQRWQIFNFTADTHPMHFHLVNVAIRKREQWAFTTDASGSPIPLLDRKGMPFAIPGTARGPDGNELGWKETVRMNPGEVITVDMKFDLPAGSAPFSPRLHASYGVKGYEYVWHCHILEHEEHDMMHALVVT